MKCLPFAEAQKAAFDSNPEDRYLGAKDNFWSYKNDEVIQHFPPQTIIGKQVDATVVNIAMEEKDDVTVKLQEIKCEWKYSNPTGEFNLAATEKAQMRNHY